MGKEIIAISFDKVVSQGGKSFIIKVIVSGFK